jgi:hypothetical protein
MSEPKDSSSYRTRKCIYTYHINNNVDVQFSAHDAFLEYPSSDTLKFKRLESQIISKSTKLVYGYLRIRVASERAYL